VIMFDTLWDPEVCCRGEKNLICTRFTNLSTIRGFLSADFVQPSSISSFGYQKKEGDRSKPFHGFDFLVSRAVVSRIQYPPDGPLLRKTHAACGFELEVENEGSILESTCCRFCNVTDIHIKDQIFLPSARTVLTLDDGTSSIQATSLPSVLAEALDVCGASLSQMRAEGPQIASRIIGRELMFRLCRICNPDDQGGPQMRIDGFAIVNPERSASRILSDLN